MNNSTSYWYDVATGQVVQAAERENEAWLGPFGTADEAREAPEMFMAYAKEWLSSEEAQPYLEKAKEELGDDFQLPE